MNLAQRRRLSSFAVVCMIWLAASVLLPTLGFFDSPFFVVPAFAVLWTLAPFVAIFASHDPSSVALIFNVVHWLAIAVWAAIPVSAAVAACKRLRRRNYVPAALLAVVPVLAIVLFQFGNDTSDLLRFRLHQGIYNKVVAEVDGDKCSGKNLKYSIVVQGVACDPVTIIFVWGGPGGLSTGWHGIVYDAGDEIIKPAKDRSEAWTKREIGDLLSCSRAERALGGHYYFTSGDFATFSGCER